MKLAIGPHFIAFAISLHSPLLRYQVKPIFIRSGSVIIEDDPLSAIPSEVVPFIVLIVVS